MKQDLNYYKNNAEENYTTTPISVLRYISELEDEIKKIYCDLTEKDFLPEEIFIIKGDKVHKDEVQVNMTVAIRNGKTYILSSDYIKPNRQ